MSKIITSARGDRVDFDLLKIKSTIAAAPPAEHVKKRERFINRKRRRGVKRKVDEVAQSKRLEDANFDAVVTDQHEPESTPEATTHAKRRKVGAK